MKRSLLVFGDPVPQGSTKAFSVKGKAFTTSTNAGPLARYRNDIRNVYTTDPTRQSPAQVALPTWDGPVAVAIVFTFKRPQSHYNSKGVLKGPTYSRPAPTVVEKKPDLDKLIRAVGDALTGYAFTDDALIVRVTASKVWGPRSSTYITITGVDDA